MRKQEFRFQTNLRSPARRGSRSRPPLRRPRPLRFERLRVPVWNPYSRGRLSPPKSEDRKGGEGKTDANLTNFLSTDAAPGTPTRRHALGRLPTRPLCRKICHSDCTENCPQRPLRAPRRFRNPKIGQQLGAQPTPRFRVMIDAMDRRRDQCNDRRRVRCRDRPMAALHFLLPTGHSQSGRRSFDSKLNLPSPARRGSRSRTASPPAPLAIRKAPSASVESIQPRPPQPCEVGRPKGRRRKNRRQSHNFFLAPAAPRHPNSPAMPRGGSPPAPSAGKFSQMYCAAIDSRAAGHPVISSRATVGRRVRRAFTLLLQEPPRGVSSSHPVLLVARYRRSRHIVIRAKAAGFAVVRQSV